MSDNDASSPPVGFKGRILAMFVTQKRGEPMTRIEKAYAHAGKGLEGDRYYDGAGTFSTKISPKHEISLIEIEALEALKRDSGFELKAHLTRRNLLTEGVPLNHLVGRKFQVGPVVLKGMELCEPCGHMEKLSSVKGARNALVHRGGLRCQIVQGGLIQVGDAIDGSLSDNADSQTRIDSILAGPEAGKTDVETDFKLLGPDVPPSREIAEVGAMPFCLIPPGPFTLGSENDPLAWDGEAPLQTHDIPYSYWIGRFPVSNAQFQEFVDDRGYATEEFWPEAIIAKVWKGGLLDSPAGEVVHQAQRQFGEPFNRRAHPASGIGWYEALAFCRWLQKRWRHEGVLPSGWEVRLPSEIEWEKAARGGADIPIEPVIMLPGSWKDAAGALQKNPLPKRRYPWGDEPDPTRANYRETGIGSTTPLGRFPGGASPYGVQELSGNVWEWTRSLWAAYPYPADQAGREASEKLIPDKVRTLKGAGFSYHPSLIRCATRHLHSPMMRYRHIGFRVAVLPPRA